MNHKIPSQVAEKKRVALLIAGTAFGYILIQLTGNEMGWPHRLLALFDLIAAAIFIFALWRAWKLWQISQ